MNDSVENSGLGYFEFPDPRTANEQGVVAVGGLLNPIWVYSAYLQGIFPWPIEFDDEMLTAWCSPQPRAVFQWSQVHVPRRLARKIRSGRFRVTSNEAFDAVISGCAESRRIDGALEHGTWITAEMNSVYRELHAQGKVHSVEVWENDVLVGGIYGVAFGRIFSGESMFYKVSDASKAGLCVLLKHLQRQGFDLMDIQQMTGHCESLGANFIERESYLEILQRGLSAPADFGVIDTRHDSW